MQAKNGHVVLSPSDVTAFLGCRHLTSLALKVARGELERPHVEDEQRDLIFRKGDEHERAYEQLLEDEGKNVLEIDRADWDSAAAATIDAMREGVARGRVGSARVPDSPRAPR